MGTVKNLIEYFVRYPVLANILIALTLIGGVVMLVNTKKSFFPTRADKFININVSYPGASPEEMEEGVTLKIEESINAIAGIKETTSSSVENSASVSIEIIESFDVDEVYTDVKNAVDGISSFPVGAEKPIIFKQRQRSTAQWLALTGEVDLKTLKNYAEQVEDELLASGKVSQVGLAGFPPLEITIEVSEKTLRRYNLTFDQVAQAVRNNNRDISAGSVKSEVEEILIRSKSKETDAQKIAEIVVRSNSDGSKLLLKDIAVIKEQFAETANQSFLNGKRAVFLEVRKLETEDLEVISQFVKDYVPDFNERAEGVELSLNWDFMNLLSQRLNLLTSNGVVGLILVMVSLGLFLSLRLSFWVAWGIPSSFLGMFVIGAFVGLTINMISLFGMILVIGILVDDGIVIAENIYAHFERHGNAAKAAVNGTMEVLPAVFTSVTTTIIAFTPLLILTGGFEFLKDMAFVVIFSLGFSLIEAFFVLPAHLASKQVLRVKKEDTRSYQIRKFLDGIIDYFRYKLYGRTLQLALKHRIIAMIVLLMFIPIVVSLVMGGQIKATFFPQIPFNSFNVGIEFKPGETEGKVLDHLRTFEQAIFDVNEEMKTELNTKQDIIENMFSSVGSSGLGESGSHTGRINVFYRELDEYGLNQFDLIERIRKEIGEVSEAEKFIIGGANRFGKPIAVRLMGNNLGELKAAKQFLKTELANIPELKEVQDNLAIGRREMLFNLRPEAYFLGLTTNDITSQMRQGFFGEEVQRFMKGDNELRVWVRYPKEDRKTIAQLEDIKIKTGNSEYPLTQLADYEIERGLAGIKHYNGARTVTIEAEMIDPFGEVPPVIQLVKKQIVPELQTKFPTVKVEFGGQSQEGDRAASEIGLYFGGAFVLIFFLIMITFKSFYQALIILAMIPLGWAGAVLGHGIEDWLRPTKEFPVSLLSAWGMVALSGVIINDAVVFLAKYNSLIKRDGFTVTKAAYEAGIARFRPILLTSMTTVLGLYPLIKESSFQAQFLIPMAISVAYGVLIGTFIILIFFPVLLIFINDMRRLAKWIWTGEKPTRENVERVVIDEERMKEFEKAA